MSIAQPGDGSVWERVAGTAVWVLCDAQTSKVWAYAWPIGGEFWKFRWADFGEGRTGMRHLLEPSELVGLFEELERTLGKAGAPILHPIRRPVR